MVIKTLDHTTKLMRNQMGLVACLITCIFLSACSNDMDKVRFFGRKELPLQTVINGHADRSEYGKLQLHLDARKIVQYGDPNPRTIYPEGLELWLYDGDASQVKAYIRAGYGESSDQTNMTKVRDSVVIIDYRSGDTSYLKDLYWDNQEHRIYSKNPIRSVNGNRVTYGDGFESDENFESPMILHQRGTIEWKEDEEI